VRPDAPPDARADTPPDARADAPPDARADAPPEARADARHDSPRDQHLSDLLPTPACGSQKIDGALPKLVMASATTPKIVANNGRFMIACEYPSGPITQCDAAKACKSPWELCSVSDYKAAVGGTVPSTPTGMEWSWLSACVRKAGVAALVPGACASSCVFATSPIYAPLMIDCSKDAGAFPKGPFPDAGVPLATNVGLMSYFAYWCWYPPGGGNAGGWAPCSVDGKKQCVGGSGTSPGGKTSIDPRRALCCYRP